MTTIPEYFTTTSRNRKKKLKCKKKKRSIQKYSKRTINVFDLTPSPGSLSHTSAVSAVSGGFRTEAVLELRRGGSDSALESWQTQRNKGSRSKSSRSKNSICCWVSNSSNFKQLWKSFGSWIFRIWLLLLNCVQGRKKKTDPRELLCDFFLAAHCSCSKPAAKAVDRNALPPQQDIC